MVTDARMRLWVTGWSTTGDRLADRCGCQQLRRQGRAVEASVVAPSRRIRATPAGSRSSGANNGVGEPWPQVEIDTAFALANVLSALAGNLPTDIIGHAHYPSRKIDPATAAAVQGPWRPRSINSSGTWNLDDIHAECRGAPGARRHLDRRPNLWRMTT